MSHLFATNNASKNSKIYIYNFYSCWPKRHKLCNVFENQPCGSQVDNAQNSMVTSDHDANASFGLEASS